MLIPEYFSHPNYNNECQQLNILYLRRVLKTLTVNISRTKKGVKSFIKM